MEVGPCKRRERKGRTFSLLLFIHVLHREGQGGRKSTGGRRKDVGKWDSQGGRSKEKWEEILQYCIIFCDRKSTKGREQKVQGVWELESSDPPHLKEGLLAVY